MAWKAPAWTKAVAVANGTNNFVLSDPSNPGPYRTDVQANADGSLPNGSTVHYVAWRTTTTGDAEAEEGYGTYTLATRAVTRTAGNVIDGSAGPGVLVDFGLSGQMDVFFLPVLDGSDIVDAAGFATNLGLPRLGVTNTFTERTQILSGSAGQDIRLVFRRADAIVSLLADMYFQDSTAKTYARIRCNIDDVTGGSEDASLQLQTIVAGTLATRVNLTGGELKDASGNRYDAFPVGTVLLSESIPTGWNAGYVTDGRMIRLAKSGDTLGSQAGTDDPFDGAFATASHVLTITEIPAHAHDHHHTRAFNMDNTGGATYVQSPAAAGGGNAFNTTTSVGSGGGHSHTIATPNHRVMVRIVKA